MFIDTLQEFIDYTSYNYINRNPVYVMRKQQRRRLNQCLSGRLPRPSSSIFFKHLLLRNHWPSQNQIHIKLLWDRETKTCSNGPGHINKMAAMPVYGRNLSKSSSPEQKGRWPWIAVRSIECTSSTKSVQTMTLGWHWPTLRPGRSWSLLLLCRKKLKQKIFSETTVVYDIKVGRYI